MKTYSDSNCSTGADTIQQNYKCLKDPPLIIQNPAPMLGPTESDTDSIACLKIKRNKLLESSYEENIFCTVIKPKESSKHIATVQQSLSQVRSIYGMFSNSESDSASATSESLDN